MDLATLLSIGALALADSLSVGTLLVPLFFLLAPDGVRAGRVLLYLAAIAGFYFAVGLAVMGGAGWLTDALETLGTMTPLLWVQLVLGGAMLLGALLFGKSAPKMGTPEAAALLAKPGRLSRWREVAMCPRGALVVVGIALGAGVLELATMLPYLAAIGIMTSAGFPWMTTAGVLAGYCAMMVMPALLLLAARLLARRAVEPVLVRTSNWLQLNGAESTAWIVGIAGFLLARDAATRLELFALLGAGAG